MEITYFTGNVVEILSELARWLLGFVGGLTLLFVIGAGVLYELSAGDPGRQKTAKAALRYALTGLLIILFSYAILEAIAGLVN